MGNISSYEEPRNKYMVPKPDLDQVDSRKAGIQTGAQNAASWASMGAKAGPIGAVVGGVAGLASGVIKSRIIENKNRKEELEAEKQYSMDVNAMNESMGEKMRMDEAAQNGQSFINRYEGANTQYMKSGGKLGGVENIVNHINNNKIQYAKKGTKIRFMQDGGGGTKVITNASSENNFIRGKASPTPKDYFSYVENEEGTGGNAYEFASGARMTTHKGADVDKQTKNYRENGDSFDPQRNEFLKRYLTNKPLDGYEINEKGDAIWKEQNIYLGNVNDIKETPYRLIDRDGQKQYQYKINGTRPYTPSLKDGGKIEETPEFMVTMGRLRAEKNRRKTEKIYRSGGSINVIPKGVTHEEKNKIGDNGIPIVSGASKKKIAEIEKNELTMNSNSSKRIEELTAEYHKTQDPKILRELGKYMTTEVMENTIDRQGELLK